MNAIPHSVRSNTRFSSGVMAILIFLGFSVVSTKAQTWTKITPAPTTEDLRSIIFANNQFVAVGTNGKILTSGNGSTWTSRTSGVTKGLFAVTASSSLFVAVGEAGTIVTSANGTTWTSRTSNTTMDLLGVACNATTFVAAGSTSAIVSSANGTTWTSRTLGATTNINGIAWGNNLFTVAGFDDMNGTISTSPDGTNWTSRTVTAPDGLMSIAWCGSAFFAGSIGIVVSQNGTSWTKYPTGIEDIIFGETGHSNHVITVGGTGTILSAANDSTWVSQNSGVTVTLRGVTWGNNLYVAVGEAGTILTSTQANAIVNRPVSPNTQDFSIAVNKHIVNVSLNANALVTVRIFSMQGQLIRSMNSLMSMGIHSFPMLSGLSQGRYILSVRTGSRTMDQPVLIAQ